MSVYDDLRNEGILEILEDLKSGELYRSEAGNEMMGHLSECSGTDFIDLDPAYRDLVMELCMESISSLKDDRPGDYGSDLKTLIKHLPGSTEDYPVIKAAIDFAETQSQTQTNVPLAGYAIDQSDEQGKERDSLYLVGLCRSFTQAVGHAVERPHLTTCIDDNHSVIFKPEDGPEILVQNKAAIDYTAIRKMVLGS